MLAPEQGDAVAFPIRGHGLTPEETAGNRLVPIIHLVTGVLDEGEMQVQLFHLGSVPSRDKYGRCQVLGGIAGDDGQKRVQVQAAAQDGRQQDGQDNA